MKHRIDPNGWTVHLEDIDLAKATRAEADQIATWLANNTVVVARNQKLTAEDQVRFCSLLGNVEDWSRQAENFANTRYLVNDGKNKIIRVTGEPDEHGRPGLFGHVSDLDWHANNTANEWRHPIIWLYGAKGTAGSRTSWLNNILTYQDLSPGQQRQLADIKLVLGFKKGAYSEDDFGKAVDINYFYTPNLIHTNIAGKTGLYFPFLQIHQIVGLTEDQSREFIDGLRRHVEQEKYMYHHNWQDGDVVIAEQWLGVHKRWRFEGMNQRVLHRIACDFANSNILQS